ncbi:MAG TPA: hypothetical protein VM328_08145 [Fimbriimonadaceae bacterium]|nr:hypothetical protein [Fimbriimonadaceae bacterium]
MRTRVWKFGMLTGVLGLAAQVPAEVIAVQGLLESFSGGQIHATNAQYSLEGSLMGTSIQVRLNGKWAGIGQWSAVPVSWQGKDVLVLTLTNLEPREVQLGVRLDATSNPNDWSKIEQAPLTMPPGATRTVVYELNPQTALDAGVRGLPPAIEGEHIRLFTWRSLDLSNMYRWSVFLRETTPASIRIENMRVGVAQRPTSGFVDRFGQFGIGQWPGRIDSAGDLAAQYAQELIDLQGQPAPSELFGATTIPNQGASGRWRVARLPSGKWYLVTPAGRPFWSFGVTCVNPSNSTIVGGRESLFQNLPSQSGDTSQFYSWTTTLQGATKRAFCFTSHNQFLKFGTTWRTDFGTHALRRLKAWGLNTLGPWADPNLYARTDLPYTINTNTLDFPTTLATPFAYWGKLPDPFSPAFGTWARLKFASVLAGHNGRSTFMGIFVDGELAWGQMDSPLTRYQIGVAALNAHATQPAKVELLRRLQQKYRRIGSFNLAWGTSFTSWNQLKAQDVFSGSTLRPKAQQDMAQFVYLYAYTYYQKVRQALTDAGLTGLYLGSRDVWATPETTSAAMPFVDVYSVTLYREPGQVDWSFPQSTRPVLIGEFSAGATDRGSFHPGPVATTDQAQRARLLQGFAQSALTSPKVVGLHWFQYFDQPITGRALDGENYNLGFVSVADVPYQELVEATRAIGLSLYALRGR